MKTFLLMTTLFVGTATFACADQPGAVWITASEVAQKLSAAGYTDISKIEADDGYWKAHTAREGHLYKVDLDPHTGKIVWSKERDHHHDHDDDD